MQHHLEYQCLSILNDDGNVDSDAADIEDNIVLFDVAIFLSTSASCRYEARSLTTATAADQVAIRPSS